MADGALVTGGTGALGTSVVRALLDDGWAVTSTWVGERGRKLTEEAFAGERRLTLVRADLSDPAQAEAAVAATGNLRAVVNLAGGYRGGGRVHEAGLDELERMLTVNVHTIYLVARAAMPRLVEAGGGAFVGVSARAAVRPFSGAAAYIAAKAAVLALVQALDAEYRGDGVRANAILPNVIDTPANRESMPGADRSRWVTPEAIAEVVAFLVSDRSTAVTGAAVPVPGRG